MFQWPNKIGTSLSCFASPEKINVPATRVSYGTAFMLQVSGSVESQRQSRCRKSHRKSRKGCVNCRFRRIKCSEEHPSCQRCRDYRVTCSYGRSSTDLISYDEQVSGEIAMVSSECVFRLLPCRSPRLKTHIDDAVMYRFRNRTVHTFGTPETAKLYLFTVPRLAVEFDYLRHTIYATTLVHDRALSAVTKPSLAEAYYLNQAAKVFGQKLSAQDYRADEKDALWATAVYLCAVSASSVESETSTLAWPLNEAQSSDLNWLSMQRGLRTVWKLTQMGDRCTSLSNGEERGKFNCAIPDVPDPGIDGVPHVLVALYALGESSTSTDHPYHAAVRYLTTLLPIKSTPFNTLKFMIFAGGMTSKFHALLQQKDKLALLLMALWYTKLFKTHWFVSSRAVIECRSIHQYLQCQEKLSCCFEKLMDLLRQACSDFEFDIADRLLLNSDPCNLIDDPQRRRCPSNEPTSLKTDMFWL